MGALIELKNIGYSYHNLAGETSAIKDVSFQVEEGEFVALVGPSGCGKSTLLSIIAGLLAPETGTIVVNNPDGSLHYPRVGYMLQHDHLFEWRTIYQNVTLGLEIHHALTKERTDYVKQLLSDYGLESFQDKRPSELSGGMKQRAALIRTLALDPQLLLLDEPFSALDYQTRLMVSADICRLIRQAGKTICRRPSVWPTRSMYCLRGRRRSRPFSPSGSRFRMHHRWLPEMRQNFHIISNNSGRN